MRACADAARNARDTEFNKLAAKLDRQIATLEDKLSREERELRQDEAELAQRKMEAMGTHAENVLGLFVGSRSTRKLSSSLTKHRQTEQAKADVDESIEAIAQFKRQLADLDKERLRLAEEINAKWGNVVNESTEITVNPKKTDAFVNLFGVAWMPYYSVQAGGAVIELPAFGVQ
jgi:chromosome segregation ATPase